MGTWGWGGGSSRIWEGSGSCAGKTVGRGRGGEGRVGEAQTQTVAGEILYCQAPALGRVLLASTLMQAREPPSGHQTRPQQLLVNTYHLGPHQLPPLWLQFQRCIVGHALRSCRPSAPSSNSGTSSGKSRSCLCAEYMRLGCHPTLLIQSKTSRSSLQ